MPSRIVAITASSPASSISWRTASSVAEAWSGVLAIRMFHDLPVERYGRSVRPRGPVAPPRGPGSLP